MNIGNYFQALQRDFGIIMNDELNDLMETLSDMEMNYQDTLDVNREFKENTVIGIYTKPRFKNEILFAYSVSAKTFFKYSYNVIIMYLLLSSFFGISKKYRKIEIIKLAFVSDHQPLIVICKTYWIRLIQRHWKRVYEERKWILDGRRAFNSIRHFELTGRYPIGLNHLPTIYGMLKMYSCSA
jgi:hypothetical protein